MRCRSSSPSENNSTGTTRNHATKHQLTKRYRNPIDPGKCYTSDAAGSSYFQNILWLTATCLYFAIITLSLFPVTRNWFDHNVNDKVGPSLVFMNRKFLESIQNFNLYRENSSSCTTSGSVSKSITLLYLGIKTVFIAVAWISWWLFVLVCSILVSGNSSAALEVLIYSGIAAAVSHFASAHQCSTQLT